MWENDKFAGEGTYYYSNGDIYSGGWVRGVRQGEGVMMFKADEAQLVGRWERGTFVAGKGGVKDGTAWHGAFKAGEPPGGGIFFFPHGTPHGGGDGRGGGPRGGPRGGSQVVWGGGAVVAANTSHTEVLRAPVK